jgi:hypothetical protein
MSATLVSSNTTIKVNAAISYSSPIASSGTIYTAPSNGYGIVHVYKESTIGSVHLTLGGRRMQVGGNGSLDATSIIAIYVGPSQSLAWTGGGIESAGAIQAAGVEFVNTP